jgi:hypothetical protein
MGEAVRLSSSLSLVSFGEWRFVTRDVNRPINIRIGFHGGNRWFPDVNLYAQGLRPWQTSLRDVSLRDAMSKNVLLRPTYRAVIT